MFITCQLFSHVLLGFPAFLIPHIKLFRNLKNTLNFSVLWKEYNEMDEKQKELSGKIKDLKLNPPSDVYLSLRDR